MASPLKLWERGLTVCEDCGAELPLAGLAPLDLSPCPNCGKQVFPPMKVRGFWLYKPLGGGGMGSVFRSLHETLDGEFAVKILPRAKRDDPSLVENLMREAEAGASFGRHPNIVPVVEFGCDEGEKSFLATEFVEGERLDDLIEHEHRLPESRALDITRQLLAAETHIASAGYLYRDMKPQNVMVCPDGTVKLFDYGLCLPLEECAHPDPKGELEGSPHYLPPERVAAAPEGEYSEIYSLGMTLFHMLTGRTYYSQAEIAELIGKHLTSLRIASVGSHLQQCRPETVAMIDKMIARTPNRRQPDFATLSAELDAALEKARDFERIVESGAAPEAARQAGYGKIKLVAAAIFAIITLCILGATLWSHLFKPDPSKALRIAAAAKLGIPADIKAPDLPLSEIQRLVEAKASAIVTQRFPPKAFDEKAERARLLKEMSLAEPLPSPPEKSEADLKRLSDAELKRLIDAEKARRCKPFDEEAERKKAASAIGVQWPPPPPSQPLDKLQKEFDEGISAQIDEKFPVKTLGQEKLKILKAYPLAKAGDAVSFTCNDGRQISGAYSGQVGGKVLVGDAKIAPIDIRTSDLWRFDESANTKRVADETKEVSEAFNKARSALKSELEGKTKEAAFKAKGYAMLKGSPVAFDAFLKAKADEAKKSHAANLANIEKAIRAELGKTFDPKAFWTKSGYRLVQGRWLPASKAVDAALKERKANFGKGEDPEKVAALKTAMEEEAREIYPAHGYVLSEGSWRPAKELLDSMVGKALFEGEKK